MTPAEAARLLQPGCPWVELREWSGLPNVKWCEETLCAWAAEPANTWSNLGYLLAAAALLTWTRRCRSQALRVLFPLGAFAAGATSLAYHASIAFATQVLDFFGMYVYFLLLVGLNLVRLGRVTVPSLMRWFWPAVVAFTVLTFLVARANLPVQPIVMVLLAAVLGTEAVAARSEHGTSRRWWYLALGLIAVAAAFSFADVSRLWCDPGNHVVQGHALWHLLGAGALFASFFHYRQFDGSLSAQQAPLPARDT
ncbi:MAG: ceramidase domain-containing protein [Myxococcales bacterium]